MKHYIYIETAKYIECALTSYADLSRITKEFTDFTRFEEVNFNPTEFYVDPKSTRLIYKNESYGIYKNFIDIDHSNQFVILQKLC